LEFLDSRKRAFTDISINKTFVVGHPNQSFLLLSDLGRCLRLRKCRSGAKRRNRCGYPYDVGRILDAGYSPSARTHIFPPEEARPKFAPAKGSARYTAGI
jgi:hypothetical protein